MTQQTTNGSSEDVSPAALRKAELMLRAKKLKVRDKWLGRVRLTLLAVACFVAGSVMAATITSTKYEGCYNAAYTANDMMSGTMEGPYYDFQKINFDVFWDECSN